MEINAQISKTQAIQGDVNAVPGSGSSVTKDSIVAALGYTPADAPDMLICAISGAGTTANPYACDKTTTEIYTAIQAGKIVQAKLGNVYYPLLVNQGPQMSMFAGTSGAANEVRTIGVTISGKVVVQSTNMEKTDNKVTSISESSTNTQYPTAKAVWDAIPQITVDTIDLDASQLAPTYWEEYSSGVFRLPVQDYSAGTVLGAFITQFSDGGDASGIIPQVMLADETHLSVIAAAEAPVTFGNIQIQVIHI